MNWLPVRWVVVNITMGIGFSKVYTCSEYDDLLGLSSLRLTKNDDALWDIRENEFYIEVE